MDRLERLQRESKNLAVDSVALDKIIDVVEAWDHDLERNPDLRMKEIAKIIDTRNDDPAPVDIDGEAAFARVFDPENQQRILMHPLTR